MSTLHSIHRTGASLATGVKAATLVVLIGIVAAVTDHAMVTTHAPASVESAMPAATSFAPASTGGFDVPENLRANAGEVPAHVEAF